MRSGGSRQKKTRHLPTRSRSSPGRSLRDFTSPRPVAAKRTGAASIRAWTTRSRRARSRTAAGRKTTRRITARAAAGLFPGEHRRPVPCGPDPAWPRVSASMISCSPSSARNSHLHFSVRKGIHERLKPVVIGGHALCIFTGEPRSSARAASVPCGLRIQAGKPQGSTTCAMGRDVTGVWRERSCELMELLPDTGRLPGTNPPKLPRTPSVGSNPTSVVTDSRIAFRIRTEPHTANLKAILPGIRRRCEFFS